MVVIAVMVFVIVKNKLCGPALLPTVFIQFFCKEERKKVVSSSLLINVCSTLWEGTITEDFKRIKT